MRPRLPDDGFATAADFAECRAIIRTGSRSFFAASLLLPPKVCDAATALYAFCRVADDAVDVGGGQLGAVDRLRERLRRIYDGRPLPLPADRAFADVVARFAIPREVPEALLEGLEWDAAGRRYEDLDGLTQYALRVAGAVGVMMAFVMGVRAPGALARACDLGVAMQLTNIARDVGEDARMGRLYLPLQWMREAGIDPQDWLVAPCHGTALGSVIDRLLRTADGFYRRADAGIACLPLACRPAIYAARLLYAEIGRELARLGFDSVSHRAVVPLQSKLALLAQAVFALPSAAQARTAPPLDAARFLVDAAGTETPAWPAPAGPAGRGSPWLGLGGRIAWVIDLFLELERREQARRSESAS